MVYGVFEEENQYGGWRAQNITDKGKRKLEVVRSFKSNLAS